MTVTVEEDFVMQKVVRDLGIELVDRVDDREVLETAWTVLNGGKVAVPDDLKAALKAAFSTVKYRLAYEGFRTLQDYLEPPKPVSPELKALAQKLDSFMGITREQRNIEG